MNPLYLILTNPVAGYSTCARAAVEAQLSFLQLRFKSEPIDEQRQIAQAIREITRGTATQLIINDDLALAQLIDADGVHVGQDDMPVFELRKQWSKMIGLSTHSVEQVKEANRLAVDYIGMGPVFSTPTKPEAGAGLGIEKVAEMQATAQMPGVAIGGINRQNLPDLRAGGIKNYCVISAVNQSENPCAAIQSLLD